MPRIKMKNKTIWISKYFFKILYYVKVFKWLLAVVVAKVETMQWHEQTAVRIMTWPDMGHVGAVVTQPRHRHHTWHQGVTRDMDHIKHCLWGRSSGNILRLSQYSVSFCCSLLLPTDIINLVFWHVKTSKSPHSNSLKTSHFWARYPLTTLHTQQTHDLEIVGLIENIG